MDSHFHGCFQQYVKPGPEMYFYSDIQHQRIYLVNAGNAPQWLSSLEAVWSGLQASLLVLDDNSKWQVKEDSPSPLMINDIVMRIDILEALLPVFVHLLSAQRAAGALQDAGA